MSESAEFPNQKDKMFFYLGFQLLGIQPESKLYKSNCFGNVLCGKSSELSLDMVRYDLFPVIEFFVNETCLLSISKFSHININNYYGLSDFIFHLK
jgi:hypothetical protein